MRFPFWIILSFTVVLFHSAAQAQSPSGTLNDGCMPTHVVAGQWVRVVGSLEAGGLTNYLIIGNTETAQGLLPIDSRWRIESYEGCIEGRNWYRITNRLPNIPSSEWVETVIMDGNGIEYWIAPVAPGSPEDKDLDTLHLFDSFGYQIESYHEVTDTLRIFSGSRETQQYFNFNLLTGEVIETDYWYRDLITRELTDQLGITANVFGGEYEDFSGIYLSPDQSQILYSVPNPRLEVCGSYCLSETLWIANIDGSNPVELIQYRPVLSHVVWGTDGRIHISLTAVQITLPDLGVTICPDGSCDAADQDVITEGRSRPFENITNMAMYSPSGEWIAVTGWPANESHSVASQYRGYIINRFDDRAIELPPNGDAIAEIAWLDDDTIVYLMQEVYGGRWGEKRDTLRVIDLDFENLTYEIDPYGVDLRTPGDENVMLTYNQTVYLFPTEHGVIVQAERQIIFVNTWTVR